MKPDTAEVIHSFFTKMRECIDDLEQWATMVQEDTDEQAVKPVFPLAHDIPKESPKPMPAPQAKAEPIVTHGPPPTQGMPPGDLSLKVSKLVELVAGLNSQLGNLSSRMAFMEESLGIQGEPAKSEQAAQVGTGEPHLPGMH